MWYPDRESNPDLLFRRELFYPLNYQDQCSVAFRVQNYYKCVKKQNYFPLIFHIYVFCAYFTGVKCL